MLYQVAKWCGLEAMAMRQTWTWAQFWVARDTMEDEDAHIARAARKNPKARSETVPVAALKAGSNIRPWPNVRN